MEDSFINGRRPESCQLRLENTLVPASIWKTTSVFFQLRQQLYIGQCVSVCPSVSRSVGPSNTNEFQSQLYSFRLNVQCIEYIKCIEYNAQNTIHRIQCREYNAQNTMHRIQCIACNAYKSMQRVQCIEVNAYNTMHIQICIECMQCIDYTAYNTVHIIQCRKQNAQNTIKRIQCIEYNTLTTMH